MLGVALAAALGAFLDMFLLVWALRRTMGSRLGPRADAGDGFYAIGIIGAGIAAGGICYGTLRIVNYFVAMDRFWGVLTQAGLATLAGAAVYGALLYLFGNHEIRQLADAARRHMFTMRILPKAWEDSLS